MSAPDLDTVLAWRGRAVRDREGDKLGRLGDLYLDAATDAPAYAGIRTGLFGARESIVPLEGIREEDGDLVVPFAAAHVRDAPHLDPEEALSAEEEEALDAHYAGGRVGGSTSTGEAGALDGRDDPEPTPVPAAGGGAERGPAPVADEPGTMIRSEEEIVTGTTAPRATERVRLRKVIVTDHVERTVPVRREEIRLETDPPPEGTIESVHDVEEGEQDGRR